MDPFTGEEGIRFNMNGQKYVMQGGFFSLTPLRETEDGVSIVSSMTGPSALDMCTITINLCPVDQLAIGTEYKTGENGISSELSVMSLGLSDLASAAKEAAETVEESSQTQEQAKEEVPPVQLQGWVKRVASETAQLELLFEFSGKAQDGTEYVIKHGFLRL